VRAGNYHCNNYVAGQNGHVRVKHEKRHACECNGRAEQIVDDRIESEHDVYVSLVFELAS
jgi:hypothetical protein